MITNPAASRTLDPNNRSFVGVVGLHDKRVRDADFNLMQSLQDWKRRRLLNSHVCSGALEYAPFQFTARSANAAPLSFSVPAFDFLFNGDVVQIGGNLSSDPLSNCVRVPSPLFYSAGSSFPMASLYVAFIEFWYQQVDQDSKIGLYIDPSTGNPYVYGNGCVNSMLQNMFAADFIDPFGQKTTERVQIQWAIRVQPVDLGYDFSQGSLGLDPGALTSEMVFAQAGQPTQQGSAPYQFRPMGPITGDTGLWRAGDGILTNNLATLDGYSYAAPLAVIVQRNTGVYAVDQNPFGTVDSAVPGSGLLASGWTARFDGKYADVVFPEDVVDTRSVVKLTGWDHEQLLKSGFADVVSGQVRAAIVRGEAPGGMAAATGSLLDYTVTVAPAPVMNTDTITAFDGYRNGFSAADQTFISTRRVTVDDKAVGTLGSAWVQNDGFVISLESGTNASIKTIQVQALAWAENRTIRVPVLLMPGQITVVGLGTRAVTVSFTRNLTGTSYDPGTNDLYVTVEVEYPANSGVDLGCVPERVYGGRLFDAATGRNISVFGVSSYEASSPLATTPPGMAIAYNPNYSDTTFGTRVALDVVVEGSTASFSSDANGNPVTKFTVPRTGLAGRLNGIYILGAADKATGVSYAIASRTITATSCIVSLSGSVAINSTVRFTFIAADTAQISYCPPIQAVTSIQETVVAGTGAGGLFPIDSRIRVISAKNYPGDHNTLVLAISGGSLDGISGDDANKFIWVQNAQGGFDAVQISNAVFAGGFVTLTLPPSVNVTINGLNYFLVMAIDPAMAPASTLALIQNYIPYQGEGVSGRDYEIVATEGSALVTTNGTGAAPVPGLRDVYPYNRSLPLVTTLPSQINWSDATLTNSPLAGASDTNYVAKGYENVEHTMTVPAHTADFIEPWNDGKRKTFQLATTGGRGFAKAIPHMGFAVAPLASKTVVGKSVMATGGAMSIFVDNLSGSDSNDGLTASTALRTIGAAIKALPDTLRHPCSVQLVPTGWPYSIASLASSLQVAALGDGTVRSAKYYALGVLAFTIQAAGRLVITAQGGTAARVTIDATGFTGFGDGPTTAFFVDNSRVIFNQIEFKGFVNFAVKGINSDVEFVDCAFTQNYMGGSFEGSTVVMNGGIVTLGDAGIGFQISGSSMGSTAVYLAVAPGANPGPFYFVQLNSNLSLDTHRPSDELNVGTATIVEAELNSSVVTTASFQSSGTASLALNSVLSQAVAVAPFMGGITTDKTSQYIIST